MYLRGRWWGLRANVYKPQRTPPGTEEPLTTRNLLLQPVLAIVMDIEEKPWRHKLPSQISARRKASVLELKGTFDGWNLERGREGIPQPLAWVGAVRAGVGG